jgi:hypothetical protein
MSGLTREGGSPSPTNGAAGHTAVAFASAFFAFLEARRVAAGGCLGPPCVYLHKHESSR